MIFWILALVLSAGLLAFILLPLVRGRGVDAASGADDTAAHDVAVYRSQLTEIARDRETGRLTQEEADAARVEIGRRLIAADDRRAGGSQNAGKSAGYRPFAAATVVAIVGVTAFGTYFVTGRPGAPDNPLAGRAAEIELAQRTGAVPGGEMPGSLADAADKLRQRLQADGGSIDDWMLLGRTEIMGANYAGAARAFEMALSLAPGDPELKSTYAEALVLWANGTVTDKALRLFQQAAADKPDDPRARFFIAEAAAQDGRLKEAMEGYIGLAADSPADAPWLNAVRARALETAETLGMDISDRLPDAAPQPLAALPPAGGSDAAPGPNAEDVAVAQAMSPEERQDMIRGMVEGLAARLAEEPMDFDGWMRLIRSRMVLNQPDAAQADLDAAFGHFARAPVPKRMLAQLAGELGLRAPDSAGDGTGTAGAAEATPPGPTQEDVAAAQEMAPEDRQAMIEGMVAQLAERLETETPDDVEGWMRLARSYDVLGRQEDAVASLVSAAEAAERAQPHLLPQLLIDQARLRRSLAGDSQTPESVELMRRVEALQPDNVEALWFLGLNALNWDDPEAAKDFFDRAVAALPEGSSERASLAAEAARLLGG